MVHAPQEEEEEEDSPDGHIIGHLRVDLAANLAALILSVQSNQFVQSKTQIMQSNTRNCAVQNLHDGCRTNRDGHKSTPKASHQEKFRRFRDIGEHGAPVREKLAGKF